jgi:hypothetical protein
MGKTIQSPPEVDTTKWFYCTCLYLVLDYGRPQDFIPGLALIRPAAIVTLILTIFVIKHWAIVDQRSKQIKTIWYFIALVAVYIPFAMNGHHAYITFTGMINFMPFILSVLVCVNSMERLRTFMIVYVGLGVYVSLYALRHNGMGSGNYFADENDVALYVNMIIPFCYFLFLIEKNKKTKIFFAGALVIGLLAVIISFSRGGFVGLVLMFFIVWLVSPRKMVSLSLILILGTVGYFFSDPAYRKDMATVTDTKESTAHARLMSWASAWDMFLDYPLGVGGNNFQVHFPDYQGDRFNRGMWGRVAHSLWFTLLPELGVLGVFIYFRLLFFNIKGIVSLKTKKPVLSEDEKYINSMSIAFLASLVGFFASASFLSALYYAHYWYLTAVIVATIQIRAKLSSDPELGPPAKPARYMYST